MRILSLALLAAFLITSFVTKRELRRFEQQATLERGTAAPPIVLPQLNGTSVDALDGAGHQRVTLITFWATDCEPCKIELPELQALYEDGRQRGLALFSINEDRDPGRLSQFLDDHPVAFPVLHDVDGAVARAYNVKGLPTTVLIDDNGEIIHVFDGFAAGVERFLDRRLRRKTDKHD